MKKQLIRATAVTVLGLSLTTGLAAAGSIDTTGPNSNNDIRSSYDARADVRNNNNLRVDSTTDQFAQSGDATTRTNTDGGDAETGDAENDAEMDASVEVSNDSAADLGSSFGAGAGDGGDASIENTGPRSDNTVRSDTTLRYNVENNNNLTVNNDVVQTAVTGDADVRNNTEGGSATTGDARNSSSSSFSFTVRN